MPALPAAAAAVPPTGQPQPQTQILTPPEQPSRAMIAAIAIGSLFILAFIIGLFVFLYCYIRAPRKPVVGGMHLPPGSESQPPSEASLARYYLSEKLKNTSTSSSTLSTTSSPPPTLAGAGTAGTATPTLPPRVAIPNQHSKSNRLSQASTLDVPPTPGREFL